MKSKFIIIATLACINFTNFMYSNLHIRKEKKFREKYSSLDIPKFKYDHPFNSYAYSYNDYYDYSTTKNNLSNDIFYGCCALNDSVKDTLNNNTPSTSADFYDPTIYTDKKLNHWALLHEAGHHDLSKKWYTPHDINKMTALVSPITLILWGKHRIEPYKNLFTKIFSKCIASTFAAYTTNFALKRYHEYYADKFANQHAKDKQTLERGIRRLESHQIKQNDILDTMHIPAPLRPTFMFLADEHPSLSSRITTIEKTMQKRFPNEP